jgi:hypothetical protein
VPEKTFLFEEMRHTADNTYWSCRWNFTYHWGIQWNYMAMQRMGSGGKGRTENRWDVSGAVQSAPSERRQICPWWHRRVLFCRQDQYLVLLYTSPLVPAESIQIATAPYLVLFQLRPFGILYRICRSTRRHTKDRNLSADHLEQFHTQGFNQHLHQQNHVVPSEFPAPL